MCNILYVDSFTPTHIWGRGYFLLLWTVFPLHYIYFTYKFDFLTVNLMWRSTTWWLSKSEAKSQKHLDCPLLAGCSMGHKPASSMLMNDAWTKSKCHQKHFLKCFLWVYLMHVFIICYLMQWKGGETSWLTAETDSWLVEAVYWRNLDVAARHHNLQLLCRLWLQMMIWATPLSRIFGFFNKSLLGLIGPCHISNISSSTSSLSFLTHSSSQDPSDLSCDLQV